MTDNEIKSAISTYLRSAREYENGAIVVSSADMIAINDLINRQQERIKTLTNSRDNWRRIAEEFDKASRETEKEVEGLQAEIEDLKIINEHLTTFNIENEAEIERLKRLLEWAEKDQITLSKQCYKEAIKEFAERLKNYFNDENSSVYDGFVLRKIDNLVKEMVGEE